MKGGKKAIKLSRLEKKKVKKWFTDGHLTSQFTRFVREVREKEEVLENTRRQLPEKEKDS